MAVAKPEDESRLRANAAKIAEKFHNKNPDYNKNHAKNFKRKPKTEEQKASERERQRRWRIENPEEAIALDRRYREKHGDKLKAYHARKQSEYRRDGRFSDTYVITSRLRSRLKMAVKAAAPGHKLAARGAADYEAAHFLVWLANRMGIGPYPNGNKWHIDHIIPCDSFDITSEEDMKKLQSPENLRWLTRSENCRKGKSLPTPEELSAHLLLVSQWRSQWSTEKSEQPT